MVSFRAVHVPGATPGAAAYTARRLGILRGSDCRSFACKSPHPLLRAVRRSLCVLGAQLRWVSFAMACECEGVVLNANEHFAESTLSTMTLVASPTEITTSATDAVLAIECVVVLVYLRRTPTGDPWRIGLWSWVFGLLTFVSFLGAVAHGFEMPHSFRGAIWKPLYLSLGVLVGLFLVGAFFDWRGRVVAMGLVPWSIGLGMIFFGLTEVLNGSFIAFIVYEALAMVSVLAIYSFLSATHRLKGAGFVATAIFLNLVAAGVQASSMSFTILVPFDYNGLFHLVQMVGIATLGLGLRMGMEPDTKREASEPDGAAIGSQPIRSEANRTSAAAGSRR